MTSAIDRDAQYFGKDAVLPRSERYDPAEEVLKVCLDLWTGWADGALVCDKRSGTLRGAPSRTLARLSAAGLPRVGPHGLQEGGAANVYRELFGPTVAHPYHPAMTR